MRARSMVNGIRSRRVAVVITSATLVATSVLVGGGSAPVGAQTPPKPESVSPEAELAVAAGPRSTLVESTEGGPVTFVGTPPGGAIALSDGHSTPAASAQAFVEEFGAAFGEPDPVDDLTVDRTTPMAAGGNAVHYQQLESGVPILAGELNVQVAPQGKVRSATGELSAGAAIDTEPSVAAGTAAETARAQVAADTGSDVELVSAGAPELWVYDPSLIDEDGPRRLVWRVEVRSDAAPVRVEVLVDAHTGAIALQLDLIREARVRQVCDNQNILGASYSCPAAGVVRGEGGGATGIAEVDRAYELSGATYDYYFNRFARDSINGSGMTLKSTVRHCPTGEGCPYANAFWDGFQMVYGDTFAGADDVVGHELTHGVTQYESNLLYANQSGAINESLSDIFGEFVDLTHNSTFDDDSAAARWLMGEDLPIGEIRDMENPPAFGQPDRMGTFQVLPNTPAGDYGGVHINSGIGNKAAFLMTDGTGAGSFNGQSITAIGMDKVGRIFYEAQINLLTSGSDFSALGNALNQACTNVIGVDGITAGDCTQVAKAVLATEMVVPAPANDNLANATALTPTTGSTTGTTVGATRQTNENLPGTTPSASIWYSFTAASNGTATIDTCGSAFDTLLGVGVGTSFPLTGYVSNDDHDPGVTCGTEVSPYWSRLQFQAVAGTTYRVQVDGYNLAKGAVKLNWTLPAAPAPTGVSGTVTETGTGTPVAGAMVAVLRSSDFAVRGGAVADGSGNFSAQVPVGSYYLYVVDPSGAHVTGFSGPPTLVAVTNGSMTDHDPSMASRRGGISGTVSTDTPPGALAGAWALSVNSSTGGPGVGTVANGSGQYALANLPARSYWTVYLDPTGARRSEFFPNSSDANGASAISVTGGATAAASVSLASQTAVGTGQTLSGTVTESGTGTPLAGAWVLALRASDFTMARGGLTNGSGQYSLNVAAGTYKLAFLDPAGLHVMEWFDNQPNTGLATSTTVTAPQVANAALARVNGSVTGTVTDDVSNAPVANAWVFAIDPTGTIAGGAVTAANGTYTVGALPAGPYRMTFVDPLGGRTQEYFDNSSNYAGAAVVNVTGGGSVAASAAMHLP